MEDIKFITSKVHNNLFGAKPNPLSLSLKILPDHPAVHVFEIRGTNGSGKSTLPFVAQGLDPDAMVAQATSGLDKLSVVVSPALSTIFVGRYPYKKGVVGGVDTISGGDRIQKHLEFALQLSRSLPNITRIFFEGIMTSTSNSRWTETLRSLGVPDTNIHVGWCNTPLDVCIERVFARSGKEFNHKLVERKAIQLLNQMKTHKELFPEVNRFVYDCMCTKEQMFSNWVGLNFEPIH